MTVYPALRRIAARVLFRGLSSSTRSTFIRVWVCSSPVCSLQFSGHLQYPLGSLLRPLMSGFQVAPQVLHRRVISGPSMVSTCFSWSFLLTW